MSLRIPAGLLLMLLLPLACVRKMPLPTEIYMPREFSAGDTTYLLLNPIWDESLGLQSPLNISIAQDGHLFVADSAAQRIFVLGQDGRLLPGFQALAGLQDYSGNPLAPLDVDVDRRMNVFFIDGSNRVYRWNQYWNQKGLAALADRVVFVRSDGSDTLELSPGTYDWYQTADNPEWNLRDVTWSTAPEPLAALAAPQVFYDGGSPANQDLDIYYDGTRSRFSSLSTTLGNEKYLFVTDRALDADKDRIIQINYRRSQLLKLQSGNYPDYDHNTVYQKGSLVNMVVQGLTCTYKWISPTAAAGFPPVDAGGRTDHDHWELQDLLWVHTGIFGANIAEWGTGAGKVNRPNGLDVDYTGSIYYAQSGNYFAVHRIRLSGTKYLSVFQEGQNDIMDLYRFTNPRDVAVDRDQNVYVANTGAREIQVFDYRGNFFRKAGVDYLGVDTTLVRIEGSDTIWVDTTLLVEQRGFLAAPRAVAVDDRGIVYICDPLLSRIVRYRLSNELDENLTPLKN